MQLFPKCLICVFERIVSFFHFWVIKMQKYLQVRLVRLLMLISNNMWRLSIFCNFLKAKGTKGQTFLFPPNTSKKLTTCRVRKLLTDRWRFYPPLKKTRKACSALYNIFLVLNFSGEWHLYNEFLTWKRVINVVKNWTNR